LDGNSVVVNGINLYASAVFFMDNGLALLNVPCLQQISSEDPCFTAIAFGADPSNGMPFYGGSFSDPILNLGTYYGSSGSAFPPPGTPETLIISADTAPVPEPSSIAFIATGLLCLAALPRRRQ
jgi:hypothetical protein